jgi:hypothetical protein
MGFADTIETTLFFVQWIIRSGYYVFPILFGLFMVLWGIFFNGWDWLLIGAGLATCLIAGWYAWTAMAGEKSR